jgi:hypothetical protein
LRESGRARHPSGRESSRESERIIRWATLPSAAPPVRTEKGARSAPAAPCVEFRRDWTAWRRQAALLASLAPAT